MQENFTSDLLLKHLYHETTAAEAAVVNNALANDAVLQQQFKQMQETKSALDEADGDTPDASVIQKILMFSKEQQLTESH